MIHYYHKTLLTLVACILLLPMALLVLISTGDFTVTNGGLWFMFVRRAAVTLIVLWFFNLMLLILTVAMKELVIGHFCFAVDTDRDASQDIAMPQNHSDPHVEMQSDPHSE